MPLAITVFSKANLKQWKKELDAIPAQIAAHEASIRQLEIDFSHHDSKVRAKEQQIKTVQSANKKVDREIELTSKFVGEECKEQEKQLNKLKDEAVRHSTSKKKLEKEKRNLEKEVSKSRKTIREIEESIEALRKSDMELTQLISDCESFLKTFKDNPKKLFDEAEARIIAFIQHYEETHPAKQNVNLRILLRELSTKTAFIRKKIYPGIEHPQGFQQGFLRLCGLVWEMRDVMAVKEPNLIPKLEDILQSMHLNHNTKLRLLDNSVWTCSGEYSAFKSEFPVEMDGLTEDTLTIFEKAAYHNAFEDLNEYSTTGKAFSDAVQEIVLKDQTPDMKFYTTVLEKAHDWLVNKKDNHALVALAEHAKGAPSGKGKVAGLILLLLSGASAFLSAAAFHLGGAEQYASAAHVDFAGDSTRAKVGTTLGAVVGFLGSIGLFCKSRRGGLSKKIMALTQTTPVEEDNPRASVRQNLL